MDGGRAHGRGAARAGLRPVVPGLSGYAGLSRTLVIGAVAADLYLGYSALRRRDGSGVAEDRELQHRRGAARVLDAASELGGTLIKAAQFASSRPDLLPAPYIEKLSTLQDRVPPRPWPVIRRALEHELGRDPKEVFSSIEPRPIAAASIAQVHRAFLRGGRPVALKVQYPGISELVEADLGALETVFSGLNALEPDVQLQPIVDYLRWTLPMELDFDREASAIRDLKKALEDRDDVVIPGVVDEVSTGRLLVMDLVEGAKITDREAMTSAGIDPGAVAELLNDVYADQLYKRFFLHADPHPGNLLVQPGPEGPRLVLLDHGLTLPLEPELVAPLARMVRAISEGDLGAMTAALKEAGLPVDEGTDLDALMGLVGVLLGGEEHLGDGEATEGVDLGRLGRSFGSGISDIPPKLLLVGRAIGLLDGITRQLDAGLDAMEIVARYTRE
ncbi:hypothetical protein GBA65_00915 [Rubrobacter marinus]|uniref:ABC1 atypical kinase-like domain-containing protein n=1 Tax=Rubrobacter marinus TaxID=2653852 RepID=A0A6G8PSY3_9ACTN|nr:AarF/UbiB family protein [Rubrobacter marinus]QIN77307.1 hypothetical protein GBA65_00915 [Rubrobacter marinus]